MRGLAFFLDAFYVVLLVVFFSGLELPPMPAMENAVALGNAFALSKSLRDEAIVSHYDISLPQGYCVRIRGPSIWKSCEAARWIGVPRIVYHNTGFVLYYLEVGEKVS